MFKFIIVKFALSIVDFTEVYIEMLKLTKSILDLFAYFKGFQGLEIF